MFLGLLMTIFFTIFDKIFSVKCFCSVTHKFLWNLALCKVSEKGTTHFEFIQQAKDRNSSNIYILCTPSPILLGGWTSYQIFKKRGGGLIGPQFLEGGCWERGGVTFFRGGGGCNFLTKNKIKSGIFYDKKSL